mmetsp:Transcript_20777/g.61882  ORF Transcript_20777/g.61882 Transcript_20777/m.61882 type:complete len:811 (-) Transcript_20777:129-2561(-)
MQVDIHNFERALRDIQGRLSTAAYVAVDLELTGINIGDRPDSYTETAAERLEKGCCIAEGYAIVQLGIAIRDAIAGTPKLASYNILVAPESTFVCESASLKFLRKFNLDLNSWIDDGVRCTSRARDAEWQEASGENTVTSLTAASRESSFICRARKLRADRRNGFNMNQWVDDTVTADPRFDDERHFKIREKDALGFRINPPGHCDDELREGVTLDDLWDLLLQAEVPLVVHGYLDVLFLLSTFQRRALPRDPVELAQLITRSFPKGIYDTAYLHESIDSLRLAPSSLKEFCAAVTARAGDAAFELEAATEARYGSSLRGRGNGFAHEAGCDALFTAQLFESIAALDEDAVRDGKNHFGLYKSADCVNLDGALETGDFSCRVFDELRETLLVAKLQTEDAQNNTKSRISAASKQDRSFFYRVMEDRLLLLIIIKLAGEDAVVKSRELSTRLPGIEWISYQDWCAEVRNDFRGRRFVGKIKSFDQTKGYGFICSAEVSLKFNCDTFLHHSQIGSCHIGDHVSFSIVLNKNKKPQAEGVRPASNRRHPAGEQPRPAEAAKVQGYGAGLGAGEVAAHQDPQAMKSIGTLTSSFWRATSKCVEGQHSLVYTQASHEDYRYLCDRCSRRKTGPCWHCPEHNSDWCPDCVTKLQSPDAEVQGGSPICEAAQPQTWGLPGQWMQPMQPSFPVANGFATWFLSGGPQVLPVEPTAAKLYATPMQREDTQRGAPRGQHARKHGNRRKMHADHELAQEGYDSDEHWASERRWPEAGGTKGCHESGPAQLRPPRKGLRNLPLKPGPCNPQALADERARAQG